MRFVAECDKENIHFVHRNTDELGDGKGEQLEFCVGEWVSWRRICQ